MYSAFIYNALMHTALVCITFEHITFISMALTFLVAFESIAFIYILSQDIAFIVHCVHVHYFPRHCWYTALLHPHTIRYVRLMALIQPLLSNTSLSLSFSPSLSLSLSLSLHLFFPSCTHISSHQLTSAHKSIPIFLQCSNPPLSLTIPRLNYWVRLQLSKLYLKGDLLP